MRESRVAWIPAAARNRQGLTTSSGPVALAGMASVGSGAPHVGDHNDDELDELPPLDGDSGDPAEAEGEYGDLVEQDSDDATLDDSTGEDAPLDPEDLDLSESEGGWLNEAGEGQELELGDVAILDFGDESAKEEGADEPGIGEEEWPLGDAPERGGLDAGEEGPLDADEELREADLPLLDADDEGEVDESSLVDPAFATEEPVGLQWAAEPWLRVGAPVSVVGATAIACAARGAVVAGWSDGPLAELVRVDLEGSCERLPAAGLNVADVRSLTVEGHVVVAIVESGRVLVSRDGGARFAPAMAPVAEGVVASDAVLAGERLWVRTKAGALFTDCLSPAAPSPARGRDVGKRSTLERCPLPGTAAAMARDSVTGGGASLLVVDEARRPTALVHFDPTGAMRREAVEAFEASGPVLMAARGANTAYAAPETGVVRRASNGGWTQFEWDGQVTALAFVDDAGTLACATYSEADDTTALVRLDAAGKTAIVARVGAPRPDSEIDGRVTAMAHDEARGVIWVAGGFGVAAFAVR
jgi:hypothetical protein